MTKKQANAIVKQFPDVIYVRRESDGDDSYLVADEDTNGIEVDTIVAIYERKDVRTLKVERVLE